MAEPKLRFPEFTGPWEQRKLGEIASSFEYGLNAAAKEFDGVNKYLRITDIDDVSHEFRDDDLTSPDTDLTAAQSYQLHEGEILFARTGASVGKSYIYRASDGLVYFAGFLIRAKIRPEYDAEFVYQNTLGLQYEKYIRVTSQRSGQPGVNAQEYAEFPLMVPGYMEQSRIGEFLHGIDNLITLHQRKLDGTKKLKKALLQKMFPKDGESEPEIRFPEFTGPWEQRKFSEVFEGLQNNTLSRAELNYEGGTIQNIHYGDILTKFGDCLDASMAVLPYITDGAKVDRFKSSYLQNGDVVIADTAEDETVGKCVEIQSLNGVKILSGLHTIPCRPKMYFGAKYLGYYMNSPAYHSQLFPLMQGIKVTSISRSALQDTELSIPKSVDEQAKIGECFSAIDETITLHQRKLDNLKKLKKSLLQQMFV